MSESKTVHVNKKTYDRIIEHLNYVPSNLEVNHYVEDNQAVVIDDVKAKEILESYSGINELIG